MPGEPGQALDLGRHPDVLQCEAAAPQRTALDADVAELRPDIRDHPVVRGRRGAQDGHGVGHQPQHVHQALVVGPEVVAPVRYAMRLVDHEQADAPRHRHEHVLDETLVGRPLGGNQQDIDAVLVQRAFDFRPRVAIGGIDRASAQAQAFGGIDLVAHQRQQRRDDQGRSASPVPQQARRDEVDEALAPAGSLDDEQAFAPVREGVDRLELSVAEHRRLVVERRPQKGQRFRFTGRDGTSP